MKDLDSNNSSDPNNDNKFLNKKLKRNKNISEEKMKKNKKIKENSYKVEKQKKDENY